MITYLGIFSLVFCVLVTFRTATHQSKHGGQSVRDSIAEAWTNIAIGFTFNYFVNLLMLPLVGAELGTELTVMTNFWLGWCYTAVSFVRQVLIRRYYNLVMIRREAKT